MRLTLIALILATIGPQSASANEDGSVEYEFHYATPANDLTHLLGPFPTSHWKYDRDQKDFAIFVTNYGYTNVNENVLIIHDTIRYRSQDYGIYVSEDSSKVFVRRFKKEFGPPTKTTEDTTNGERAFIDDITTIWEWDRDSVLIRIRYQQNVFNQGLARRTARKMLAFASRNEAWTLERKRYWSDSIYYAIKGDWIFDQHYLTVGVWNPYSPGGLGKAMAECLVKDSRCLTNDMFEKSSSTKKGDEGRSIGMNVGHVPSRWLALGRDAIGVPAQVIVNSGTRVSVTRQFEKLDTFILESTTYQYPVRSDDSCIAPYRKKIDQELGELDSLDAIKYRDAMKTVVERTECAEKRLNGRFVLHERTSPLLPKETPVSVLR